MADGLAILDPIEGGEEIESSGADETEVTTETENVDGKEQAGANESASERGPPKDPYSREFSKEMATALKAWRDADPNMDKFARQAKDDHARLFQLQQLEPKGIDGVREKYALLDGIMHGDVKGLDAVTAMQDQLREFTEVDQLIASGDPRALEALGDDFNEGLAKLAPALLDRVRDADPAAYTQALTPHIVDALRQSPLVSSFNALVDVLNEQPPSWLTADQKSQWTADKFSRLVGHVGGMGEWMNQLAKQVQNKVADLNAKPGQSGRGNVSSIDQREQALNQREQQTYWKENIFPETDKMAIKTFQELFKPYEKRLRLDQGRTQALLNDFVGQVKDKMLAKKQDGSASDYSRQIQRYHSQRNPDARSVVNFWQVEFNRHAQTVLKALVDQRYGPFLSGKPNNANAGQNGNAKPGVNTKPLAPGVQIVTVRPADNEIDHAGRTLDQIYKNIFPLKNGKVVQVRK